MGLEGRVLGTDPLHTHPGQVTVCLDLILQPDAPTPFLCTLHVFILGEVVAGCSHRHVRLVA
jgi:hypothetical protein